MKSQEIMFSGFDGGRSPPGLRLQQLQDFLFGPTLELESASRP